MIKKIVVGVFAFATFMVLAGGAGVAGGTIATFGSAVGGGAKIVGTTFVPAVFNGITGPVTSPTKPDPTPPPTTKQ